MQIFHGRHCVSSKPESWRKTPAQIVSPMPDACCCIVLINVRIPIVSERAVARMLVPPSNRPGRRGTTPVFHSAVLPQQWQSQQALAWACPGFLGNKKEKGCALAKNRTATPTDEKEHRHCPSSRFFITTGCQKNCEQLNRLTRGGALCKQPGHGGPPVCFSLARPWF